MEHTNYIGFGISASLCNSALQDVDWVDWASRVHVQHISVSAELLIISCLPSDFHVGSHEYKQVKAGQTIKAFSSVKL